MKTAFRLAPLLCVFASCGTITQWRELRTSPMTYGECYDGFTFIASGDGFSEETNATDRGYGSWQSRWRQRQIGLGRLGRYRLKAEIMIDEGSPETGWPIRFAIEQQKVKDLRKTAQPEERDWSFDGQDSEREVLLGEKLVRRLAPRK